MTIIISTSLAAVIVHPTKCAKRERDLPLFDYSTSSLLLESLVMPHPMIDSASWLKDRFTIHQSFSSEYQLSASSRNTVASDEKMCMICNPVSNILYLTS